MQKNNITKEELKKLYLDENLTVEVLAKKFEVGTATINRWLKNFNIKKSEEQRRAAISKTKQNKTDEEKKEYAEHISKALKGKYTGTTPWNKGKKSLQGAWNKGIAPSEEVKKKISETKKNWSEEKKAEIEAKRRASRTYGSPWNKGTHLSEEQKEHLRQVLNSKSAEEWQKIVEKQYNTKKANGTSSTSKAEVNFNQKLIKKFGQDDVIWHYSTDERYPFESDFYVKSLDLFIELHVTWTHGLHLFDEKNKADVRKLETWIEKAKSSDFYASAIKTWTYKDPLKLQTAKENNLNYLVFYTEEEAMNYEF